MKLSINCIEEIQRLRRLLSITIVADRLALPRHVVKMAAAHYPRLKFRTSYHAAEIPGTRAGIWRCNGCGQFLEFAPCVKCGAAAGVPRQVKRPAPGRTNVGRILEASRVYVDR